MGYNYRVTNFWGVDRLRSELALEVYVETVYAELLLFRVELPAVAELETSSDSEVHEVSPLAGATVVVAVVKEFLHLASFLPVAIGSVDSREVRQTTAVDALDGAKREGVVTLSSHAAADLLDHCIALALEGVLLRIFAVLGAGVEVIACDTDGGGSGFGCVHLVCHGLCLLSLRQVVWWNLITAVRFFCCRGYNGQTQTTIVIIVICDLNPHDWLTY